uniref:DAZ-associated protein 2 n=1 Tax=Falco tinnunculus TaxID=100819 RepID=A0A8C4V4P9_FALTI
MSAAYPGASVFLPVAQSVAVGPIGSSVPMAYYPVGPMYPPGSTVLVEGGFDAGARFGAGGTPSIPVSTNVPPKPRVLRRWRVAGGSRGEMSFYFLRKNVFLTPSLIGEKSGLLLSISGQPMVLQRF